MKHGQLKTLLTQSPGLRRLLILVLSCLSLPTRSVAYDCREGQPHADFTLPRIDTRQPVSLSDFLGRKVLIVHFASW